jgi:hypothetical protein
VTSLEPQLARYLASVVGVLDETLGEALAAVWLLGSAGAGAYEHGLSDLDVAVAVGGRTSHASKRQLAASLSHAALLGPIPRDAIVAALRMSLDSFDANEPDRASVVLAACRAWRFAEEGCGAPSRRRRSG